MYKIFTVIKNSETDYDQLHNLIVTETDNVPNIPNEPIECIKRKSSLRSSYRMTDEQADILRGSPDIRAVQLDHQYNSSDGFRLSSNRYASETYSYRPQYRAFYKRLYDSNGIKYGYDFPWKHMGTSSNTSLRQTYSKLEEYAKQSVSYNNQNIVWLRPTNLSDSNSDVLSWSKIRTKYKYNPWQNVSSGIIQNDNILNGRDGTDVDIIIQDNGVDKYHPEFLDSQGNSRVKDIVVDGPEYIDPTYFASNPNKTYIDWWEDSSSRSSQFQSLDTITVPRFTVLQFVFQVGSPSISAFQNNIGKVVIQTVNGAEYTRGKIVEVTDVLGSSWFLVRVQLDRGKPHFRYWGAQGAGNPYDENNPYPAVNSSPGYITIDPSGSNTIHVAPNVAAGFVYNESSVLMNNPNNTPIDSTGNKTLAETMAINSSGDGANHWADGTSATPVTSSLEYQWDTTTTPSTWQGYTLEYHLGLQGKTRTHGTHCASEAAGNKFGYAPNANIWSILVAFSGVTWASGEVGFDGATSFDVVRIFHQAKPVNSTYGNKNPSILSGSWSYTQKPFNNRSDGDTISYSYRGTSSTYTFTNTPPDDDTTTPDFIKNSLYTFKYRISNQIDGAYYTALSGQNVLSSTWWPLNDVDIETAGQECFNSGVHMCFSASNDNAYVVRDSSDQDYNNYVVNSEGDNVYLHRLGAPSTIVGSINVGALSCSTRTDGSERKDYYSNKGPGVDIYAPALNTLSANSHVRHNRNSGEGTKYWAENYAPDADKVTLYKHFSGTSSACPNVAGVMTLFLQKNRTATTTQAREWLLGTSSTYTSSGSYIDNNLPNTSLNNFWGDYHSYTTSINNTVDEQTYTVGNVSIVLDANHHIAMTETAESFMDSDVKLLYNPYASTSFYDDSDTITKGSLSVRGNVKFTGLKIDWIPN